MLVMMLLVVSLVVRFREIYRETYRSVMSPVGREMLRLTKNKLKMYGKDTLLDLDSVLRFHIHQQAGKSATTAMHRHFALCTQNYPPLMFY